MDRVRVQRRVENLPPPAKQRKEKLQQSRLGGSKGVGGKEKKSGCRAARKGQDAAKAAGRREQFSEMEGGFWRLMKDNGGGEKK